MKQNRVICKKALAGNRHTINHFILLLIFEVDSAILEKTWRCECLQNLKQYQVFSIIISKYYIKNRLFFYEIIRFYGFRAVAAQWQERQRNCRWWKYIGYSSPSRMDLNCLLRTGLALETNSNDSLITFVKLMVS